LNLGLKGRVALVCGASQGLGRASAEALAREGANVALVARRKEVVEQAASTLSQTYGIETFAIAADLVEEGACEEAGRKAGERFSRIDVLVANAGGPPAGAVEAIDDATWRRAFELTFLTTVRLARAVLPGMADRKWGRVVVIGSGSMVAPIPNLATSSGLRPGLVGALKLFAERYAPAGVTVNIAAPGYIRTERLAEIGASDAITKDIPMARLGEPEELGDLVAFLASERAGYITGQVVLIDGGRNRVL
jgi:3-oxoacyl-[acyl-carrier protein] reductase